MTDHIRHMLERELALTQARIRREEGHLTEAKTAVDNLTAEVAALKERSVAIKIELERRGIPVPPLPSYIVKASTS